MPIFILPILERGVETDNAVIEPDNPVIEPDNAVIEPVEILAGIRSA